MTGRIHAWTDVRGNWHVRVSRAVADTLQAAVDTLADVLRLHYPQGPQGHIVRVPQLDDAGSVVYCEA